MTAPDISVVMGVYNGAEELPETIESILGQQGVQLELIVVNDGSSDQSQKILQRYKEQDSRVVILDQANQGLTRALINGCTAAKGRYIARHDVGDTSEADRFRLQQCALDADPRVGFISSWTSYYGPNWEHLFTEQGSGRAKDPLNILPKSNDHRPIDAPSSHPSVMFRRDLYELVGGYRSEFFFAQDYDLWLRLAERSLFQMLELPLYRARITPTSISPTSKKLQERFARLAWDAFHVRRQQQSDELILKQAEALKPQRRHSASAYRRSKGYYFIGEMLRRNNDGRAAGYLSKSVATFPLNLKPWLRLAQTRLRPRTLSTTS